MLTPQEVAERSFPKARFGGYGMAEVDEFLDVLTEDYTALYKENAMLKNKMKVLVEKISEYRSTEDAMRTTLLTAQKMASSMISEAEETKAKMLKDAEGSLQEHLDQLHVQIADEQARLETAQSATASFVAKIRNACEAQLASLNALPNITAAPAPQATEDPVEAAADEIDSSLHKIVSEEASVSDVPSDFQETEQSADPSSPNDEIDSNTKAVLDELEEQATRKINFNDLRFGRDYEVK
ncbi:MAG: DivIVA domain-containing protein [Oscillospiraceae bacterium]|nr:DivIVA domain-containing protein [Oscillospiraceae bacterium]